MRGSVPSEALGKAMCTRQEPKRACESVHMSDGACARRIVRSGSTLTNKVLACFSTSCSSDFCKLSGVVYNSFVVGSEQLRSDSTALRAASWNRNKIAQNLLHAAPVVQCGLATSAGLHSICIRCCIKVKRQLTVLQAQKVWGGS